MNKWRLHALVMLCFLSSPMFASDDMNTYFDRAYITSLTNKFVHLNETPRETRREFIKTVSGRLQHVMSRFPQDNLVRFCMNLSACIERFELPLTRLVSNITSAWDEREKRQFYGVDSGEDLEEFFVYTLQNDIYDFMVYKFTNRDE